MSHQLPDCDNISVGHTRLLYVGEDLPLIRFLRQAFHEPKYHVVSCPDRGSAEMFIESKIPYQLFIFDHEMQHRAAFDLTRLVRSLNHRKHLPTIVVGGEAENSLHEFTRAAGGDEYVQKLNGFSKIRSAIALTDDQNS